MPSYASKPLLPRTRTRKGLLRSAGILAAVVISSLTSQAHSQVLMAENTHAVYPIEMAMNSGNAARIGATWMPTALSTSNRTISLAPSGLYSRSIAALKNSVSSTPTNEIFHGPAFPVSSQVIDSKRDRIPQLSSTHHTRGLFGGAASWILQEAIGDDGIADLKNGCRIAKRLALLRQ